MDALEAVFTRRSVRAFTGEGIDDRQMETILKAAMAAPSAANMRAWAFVAVRNADTLKRLAEGAPNHACLPGAEMAVVACVDRALDTRENKDNTEHGVAAAGQNMLLSARAVGLGGVWLAVYPRAERMRHIRETLGIPQSVEPFAILAFGHPKTADERRAGFEKEKVHLERW